MSKRLSKQNVPEEAASENLTTTDVAVSKQQPAVGSSNSEELPARTGESASAGQQPPEGSAESGTSAGAGAKAITTAVGELDPNDQKLVCNMLIEGATFEDVVDTFDERGGVRITLAAVQNYFQSHPDVQAKRARHMVKSAEDLLAALGKDPKSAEARLARAAFLTGYMKVRREGSVVSAKDAERVRMVRENVTLKRRLLIVQKQKALQALRFSEAKTHFIVLSQEKLREEILKLQQEANRRQAGEPMGPEMLQRIQQIYGLACQPLLGEESANDSAKA
jgi:hypothetical protein